MTGLVVLRPEVTLQGPEGLAGAIAVLAAEEAVRVPVDHFWEEWAGRSRSAIEHEVRAMLTRTMLERTPDEWCHPLAVLDPAGALVGVQTIKAKHFAADHTVTTASWVRRDRQGEGLGTAARRAALHLAFTGLGAGAARTDAWHDNGASLAVTHRLGYEPDGETVEPRGDGPTRKLFFRLSRERWFDRVDDGFGRLLEPAPS